MNDILKMAFILSHIKQDIFQCTISSPGMNYPYADFLFMRYVNLSTAISSKLSTLSHETITSS